MASHRPEGGRFRMWRSEGGMVAPSQLEGAFCVAVEVTGLFSVEEYNMGQQKHRYSSSAIEVSQWPVYRDRWGWVPANMQFDTRTNPPLALCRCLGCRDNVDCVWPWRCSLSKKCWIYSILNSGAVLAPRIPETMFPGVKRDPPRRRQPGHPTLLPQTTACRPPPDRSKLFPLLPSQRSPEWPLAQRPLRAQPTTTHSKKPSERP